MSMRGIWVIKPPIEGDENRKEGEVLFSKRFLTVEDRFKTVCEPCGLYYPIPLDAELCADVILRCSPHTDVFVKERDSVSIDHMWPIYELFDCKLWPVVCLELDGLMYVAIVSFEPEQNKRPLLVKLTGIPAALSLLRAMSQVLGTHGDELTRSSPQIVELYRYICIASPFGTPSETNPSTLKLHIQFRKATAMPKEKMPAWRPAVYKGPSKIHLQIREEIKAEQYDRVDVEDVWDTFGTVNCKAELETHPDVILSLTTPPGYAQLDHLLVHPCVSSADANPHPEAVPGPEIEFSRKMRFSPPLDLFPLCHYKASTSLPIRAFYQMKGDKIVDLLVQLKLQDGVKNNFDILEVRMPFYNSLTTIENKQTLVWSVGQKLSPKTLEASLHATVIFAEFPRDEEMKRPTNPQHARRYNLEKFCVEQNAYCELHFKICDFTLSGVSVDPRSVSTLPSIKYKLSVAREFFSNNYRIWNSHGDVLSFPSLKDNVGGANMTAT